MSDDDRDVDVDVESDAEKRAHHNALERKRRDHIKESFHNLRDSVPSLQGEKVRNASRAQILKQATDYIQFMTKKNCNIQTDIDDLRKQNNMLEQQVKVLEKAKTTGSYIAQSKANPRSADSTSSLGDNSSESDTSDSEPPTTRRKRIKVEKQ